MYVDVSDLNALDTIASLYQGIFVIVQNKKGKFLVNILSTFNSHPTSPLKFWSSVGYFDEESPCRNFQVYD